MRYLLFALSLFPILACSVSEAGSPPGQAVPETPLDQVISSRVREAILVDRDLRPEAGTVRVATKDAVVTLSGSVRNGQLKQRMERVARSVGSVGGVSNLLSVSPEPKIPVEPMETALEREISDRVRLAFSTDSTLVREAGNIRVVTQSGVVHLTGAVRDPAARDRATIVAAAVGSVVGVENRLTIVRM